MAIAVVSWNTRELLRDCLGSLAPEREAGRAEVWVVDNASDDGSPEAVESDFPWARLIRSEENLGFGRAVNAVARRARTPWIAPANADTRLAPGALGALLEAGDADPRIAAVAPRLITPDGGTQHSVHRFPSLRLALALNLGLQHWVPGLGNRLCLEGFWDPDRGRAVDWAHGAFLLVRRAAFDDSGGFDERQWMYAEDLDLGWRLRRAGGLTRYEPRARVHHEVAAATRQAFADDRNARHLTAAYAWMTRRRGVGVARAHAAISAAGAWLRWAALAPLARARPARWAAPRARARAWARLHPVALRDAARNGGRQAAARRPRGGA